MLRFPAVKIAAFALALALSFAWTQGAHAQSNAPSANSMRELARQVALDLEHRAAVSERDGQPMIAEGLLRRAIDADSGYLSPYLGYARLLAARGRFDEASHVLAIVPTRAVTNEHDVVELGLARSGLGDLDGALELLTTRADGAESARTRAQLCARAGRFPEALIAARRLADVVNDASEVREARLLVRALAILVGDADAVRVPGADANALRRALAE